MDSSSQFGGYESNNKRKAPRDQEKNAAVHRICLIFNALLIHDNVIQHTVHRTAQKFAGNFWITHPVILTSLLVITIFSYTSNNFCLVNIFKMKGEMQMTVRR